MRTTLLLMLVGAACVTGACRKTTVIDRERPVITERERVIERQPTTVIERQPTTVIERQPSTTIIEKHESPDVIIQRRP